MLGQRTHPHGHGFFVHSPQARSHSTLGPPSSDKISASPNALTTPRTPEIEIFCAAGSRVKFQTYVRAGPAALPNGVHRPSSSLIPRGSHLGREFHRQDESGTKDDLASFPPNSDDTALRAVPGHQHAIGWAAGRSSAGKHEGGPPFQVLDRRSRAEGICCPSQLLNGGPSESGCRPAEPRWPSGRTGPETAWTGSWSSRCCL
jgi:hypothetical protein